LFCPLTLDQNLLQSPIRIQTPHRDLVSYVM